MTIADVIRNAVVFNPKNWPSQAVNADSLLASVERLFALLQSRQVDCVLAGGVALLHYVEGRNTEDVDLIMALDDVRLLPEIQVLREDPDFLHGQFEGLRVDVLLTRNPLFRKVQRRFAARTTVLGRELTCATVEGLLLLKLFALPSLYRQGNFARVGLYENDIATLIQAYRPDVPALLQELEAHLSPSDLGEVEAILGEIRARIARFENR